MKDAIVVEKKSCRDDGENKPFTRHGQLCTHWPACSSAANDFSGHHRTSEVMLQVTQLLTVYMLAFVVREVHWSRIVGISSGTLLSGGKMLSCGLGIV